MASNMGSTSLLLYHTRKSRMVFMSFSCHTCRHNWMFSIFKVLKKASWGGSWPTFSLSRDVIHSYEKNPFCSVHL